MARHAQSLLQRRGRVFPGWLKATLIALLLAANLVAFGVWWTIRSAEGAFRANVATVPDVAADLESAPVETSQPIYFLVIGTDSRQGVDTDVFGNFAGARGDVVMVARIDRQAGKAQLLSVPRDTLVEIEGRGQDRINAAYAYGGASMMVRTIRENFDVPLHHYVEIGFAGFQDLVDEIDGVAMTFDYPARDAKSHLDVGAGSVTLDGFQALALARSRSYQELRDGAWVSVDANDIGRTERQQALLLAILSDLKRPSTLTESGSVVASLARHMTVDVALANSSLAELAFSMREIGGSDIETATLPTTGGRLGDASVQIMDQPEANGILAAFRDGRPMEVDEVANIISVDVLNGNGVAGNAAAWASRLSDAGYDVNRVTNSDLEEPVTKVVVSADRAEGAELLVDVLGFGEVQIGPVPADVDAVVILGADAAPVS